MPDGIIHTHAVVTELTLLANVVFQRFADGVGTGVIHGFAPQHLFTLGDVIVADATGKLEDALKQTTMNRRVLRG